MAISNVSFKSVIALTGPWYKVHKVTHSLVGQPGVYDEVLVKDVTQNYKTAQPGGLLARAAKRGNRVAVCITGDDVQKVKDKQYRWDTIPAILSNMAAYYDLRKESVKDVLREFANMNKEKKIV